MHAEFETAGEPTEEIDARTAALLRAVLVHEHFHAALAYGLDRLGRIAGSVKSARLWDRGRNLNEALAAWMELHLSREDPWLSARVREWITAGAYPIWPYYGALHLERLYEAQGLSAIQELITSFRADPEAAQDRFERAVAGASSTYRLEIELALRARRIRGQGRRPLPRTRLGGRELGTAVIGGVGVDRTAKAVCDLIVNRENALGLPH